MRAAIVLALLSAPFVGVKAQVIEGHLVDAETREPIILAQMTLLSEAGQVADMIFTDQVGYFAVTSAAPGSFFLRAERLGYVSRVEGIFDLGEGGRLTVEFPLRRAPVALDTLMVEVERRELGLTLRGFYDRKKSGMGRFLDPGELERRVAIRATDFLRMIPRVQINEGRFGRRTVSISRPGVNGGACYPRVLINGQVVLLGGRDPALLDDVVSAHEIAGIEVYRGAAETPVQFGGTASSCGAVLVWTKWLSRAP